MSFDPVKRRIVNETRGKTYDTVPLTPRRTRSARAAASSPSDGASCGGRWRPSPSFAGRIPRSPVA